MRVRAGLSGKDIKLIAVISMLIDHICKILYLPYISLCGISDPYSDFTFSICVLLGRIAFPLFCFMISEGILHSSSRLRYAIRLLLFAFISEIPYDLAFSGKLFDPGRSNVIFTLFLGFLAVVSFNAANNIENKSGRIIVKIAAIVGCSFISAVIHSDYSILGVVLIVILSFCHSDRYKLTVFVIIWIVAGTWLEGIIDAALSSENFNILNSSVHQLTRAVYEFPAVFSLPIIFHYNGEKGNCARRYFFYLFYPVHLTVLYFLQMFIYS